MSSISKRLNIMSNRLKNVNTAQIGKTLDFQFTLTNKNITFKCNTSRSCFWDLLVKCNKVDTSEYATFRVDNKLFKFNERMYLLSSTMELNDIEILVESLEKEFDKN